MDDPSRYEDDSSDAELRAEVDRLAHEVEALKQQSRSTGPKRVRMRSQATILGLPWYDVAFGPDFQKGELRGYAKGILAVGDVACGAIALGGVACGLLSIGGVAFGLLGVMGGLALGGFAFGGVAVGLAAYGGVAVGYYALGGLAIGAEPLRNLFQDYPR